MHEDLQIEVLRNRDTKSLIPPLHGVVLKKEADVMRFERLTFMSRRGNACATLSLRLKAQRFAPCPQGRRRRVEHDIEPAGGQVGPGEAIEHQIGAGVFLSAHHHGC